MTDHLILIAVVATSILGGSFILRASFPVLPQLIGIVVATLAAGLALDAPGLVGAAAWVIGLVLTAVGYLLSALVRSGWPRQVTSRAGYLAWSGAVILLGFGLPPLLTPGNDDVGASVKHRIVLASVADQADRRSGAFLLDTSRDGARRRMLRELLRAHSIGDPATAEAAAIILVHGDCEGDFLLAMKVLGAVPGLTPEGWRLARIAEDRWLLARGLPQRHNTQIAVRVGQDCQT